MTHCLKVSIADHFGQVKDPRNLGVDHLLLEIMTIAICGADSWVEIEEFGQAKKNGSENFYACLRAFRRTTSLVGCLV